MTTKENQKFRHSQIEAKYARIRAGSVQLQYLPSSPKKFVQLLGNLKSYGNIQSFVLDVCPHCMTFPRLNTNSMLAPADVLQIWAIHKSGELARESLYFASAKEAAGRGNLQEAKETTLEAIQHVTTDSARLHLLLGYPRGKISVYPCSPLYR